MDDRRRPLLGDARRERLVDPVDRLQLTRLRLLPLAVPAAELAADGAEVVARGPSGERTIAITDWIQGVFTNALADDEMAALTGEHGAYVDDAFGAAHRAHASVVGVPEVLGRRAAGRLMAREVAALSRLLEEPERPFVAILGGAKISGKIDTLKNLLPRLDVLLLGGGMANTFLAARGADLGKSLVEEDRLDVAREILDEAARRGVKVVLPEDLVVTTSLDPAGDGRQVAAGKVPADQMAVDVGSATRERFAREVGRAATLFWNGPLGVFETPPFDQGTRAVADALASCRGFTVVGGGETVAAVHQAGVADRIGHVSTGGGASLELLAGKELPGVAVLRKDQGESGRGG